MKKLILLVPICLLSCVSATMNVDSICVNHQIDVPGGPSGVEVTVSEDFPIDISGTLNSVKSLGDLSVSLNDFVLSSDGSDFSWLTHISVLGGSVVLADADVRDVGSTLKVPLSPTGEAALVEMLKTGPTLLHIGLTGKVPTAPTHANDSLCVSASASVHKGL